MKTFKFLLFLIIFTTTSPYIIGKNITSNSYHSSSQKYITNKDLIILDESNFIDIYGEKFDYIKFSITKKITYKVLSEEGLKRVSQCTIPETFDPSYISHFPKNRNYTFIFSYLKYKYFKEKVIKKNKEKFEINLNPKFNNVRMVMPEKDLYGNYQNYTYQLQNIEVGDEVTIEYNYEIPYNQNWELLSSFRIFFNNDIYKENYHLAISFPNMLTVNITNMNGAKPDSVVENKKLSSYYWNVSNLNGCINEVGSHPYLSLPHILFSIKPVELLYTLPASFEQKYIPFYALYSNLREGGQLGILLSVQQGVKSKEFVQIDKFIKAETEDIKVDSFGYQKILKIHNNIADNFKFDNDTIFFKSTGVYQRNIGADLNAKTIRDINRYDVYVALISKLGLYYNTAYLCDNRTGEINNEYFSPMYDSDFFFVIILKNNTIHFLYPKSNQFGYYLNEMPFYFENSKARLVSLVEYLNIKRPINENLRQINFPGSNINENTRKSSVLVNINLDSLTTDFKAKINLTGQYSTLTRGLYLCNFKDATINDLYAKKIWELNEKVLLINQETKILTREFPFTTNINAHYKANNLIKSKADTLSLNLKNWFFHIIYQNIDINERQLDFYPDFCGKDSYVYFLQFDKNVKLINSLKDTEISNELGDLIIKTEQVNPNSIKITSHYEIKNNIITTDKIKAVKDIYDKIEELNNSSLLFTKE